MTIKLSRELLDGLPEPDSQGLVRVTASVRLNQDGTASVVELNDSPLPTSEEEETDDQNPMPASDLPDLSQVEDSLYQ